ncbi:PAS domain S-box protein [Zeaxanthinibacter sp. PT1]|uniref:PAS domain-containing sensor histidine kinase n=1 Tax=Zeaxanthinibacter TaxID=561554 RepID=UPI002349FBCB|nr:PAS domain S-box protein [Zeaxanthinibacter sp. PT1]MDC6350913.1 PAS domain S-box protein [Zeaxanthinibacter sp. PT1]
MPRHISEKDWSDTPLGPYKEWPAALKSMLSVILENPFPMYIAWGEDFTQLYNDAFIPILGKDKHPKALGQSTRSNFVEIWEGIGPLLEETRNGKAVKYTDAEFFLDRNGDIEQTYFDFSYSPIRLENGEIGGILATCIETTSRKISQEALRESMTQFKFAIEASELGTFDFNPHSQKFSANERLKEWFGLPPKEEINLSDAIKAICEDDRDRVTTAITNALDYSSGGHYDIVYSLTRKGNAPPRTVHAKGKVSFDPKGIAQRFTGTLQDITERKAAERLLKIKENNLRLMILQAPVAIAILRGNNFVIEIANKAALELWGKKEGEVLHFPVMEVMPELKAQGIGDLLRNVFESGDRFATSELPVFIDQQGKLSTKYINFSYEPLYDAFGEIDGIMTIGIDVTEQVLARQKVEANEEKLNLIINASDLGFWELNLKNYDVDCSDRCYEIFGAQEGYKPSHAEMKSQLHPEDLPIRNKAYDDAMTTGVFDYQARIILPDDSIHWIEMKGKVIFDEQHNPDRMLGTMRDITEERTLHQQLEEREERFRLLADSMPQFVWTSDPEGKLNYFNNSVFRYSGMTYEELVKDGWIQMVHPEDQEENLVQWQKSIETGDDFIFEHRFRSIDGEFRWQLSRAIPQRDEEGRITRWVGTSTDIQDQKMFTNELEKQVLKRTAELKEKNDTLEKMNQELKSFTFISSHDLQEPLRKIRIFAGLLQEREVNNMSPEGMRKFTRIIKSAARMQTLIEALLLYSRTNTGKKDFKKVPMTAVLQEIREDLKEELESGSLVIKTGHLDEVCIIPFQFHQLLHNLLTNAIKFTKPDTTPTVHISSEIKMGKDLGVEGLEADDSYCHIRVEDNGIGFDQTYANKIFELFQRLHAKDQYEGTGMGLAIVKKIVENHNGQITAEGISGVGATFNIYIPDR